MINAKELRIGNLVQGPKISIPRMGIHSEGIIEIMSLYYKGSTYDPIPLTEDWLIKLGFSRYALGAGFIWTKGSILSGRFSETSGFIPVDHSLRHIVPVPSVHKLQNLFYVLSGEELTIN